MNPTTAEPAGLPDTPDRPAARPQPGLVYYARKGLRALASLQLTVVLFALSIGLVFFGTVAQIDYGIWTVVDKYFWSWMVWVPFDLFSKFAQVFFGLPKDTHWGGYFPFPGGKLLGGAMLLNLLAAHLVRFKLTWKRAGILLIHGGLILLFVGEFVTREYAVEQRMAIDEGRSADFTESTRVCELALIDTSDPTQDKVTVVPQAVLQRAAREKTRITDPQLPVDVEVVEYMVNSALEQPRPGETNPATAGHGLKQVAVRRAEVSGVDPKQQIDAPSAYVKLFKKGTDQVLGVYLSSLWLKEDTLEIDGKKHELTLRFERYYKPYTLHLIDFRFDKYMGTEKPRNYSSQVVLRDPEMGVEREVTIRMNEPLRHRGETFYQSSFDSTTETTTYLQVVKNPGWLIPYISCVMVTLGLLVHFGMYLTTFLLRRAAA
jgi:hypothetical protein